MNYILFKGIVFVLVFEFNAMLEIIEYLELAFRLGIV